MCIVHTHTRAHTQGHRQIHTRGEEAIGRGNEFDGSWIFRFPRHSPVVVDETGKPQGEPREGDAFEFQIGARPPAAIESVSASDAPTQVV